MQRDLDALMDWGSTWGMKFNAKKCNIMRVLRSRKPLQHFYSLVNEILQEVSETKYLGRQIDNKLDWNKHLSIVASRGQSKLAVFTLSGPCRGSNRPAVCLRRISKFNTYIRLLKLRDFS